MPAAAMDGLLITPRSIGAEVWAMDLGPAVGSRAPKYRKGRQSAGDSGRPASTAFCSREFRFRFIRLACCTICLILSLLFRICLRYVKPGGEIQIYLYWKPEGQPIKRVLLAMVTAAPTITTRFAARP